VQGNCDMEPPHELTRELAWQKPLDHFRPKHCLVVFKSSLLDVRESAQLWLHNLYLRGAREFAAEPEFYDILTCAATSADLYVTNTTFQGDDAAMRAVSITQGCRAYLSGVYAEDTPTLPDSTCMHMSLLM
jgi:hypothetical protein